jgi:Fic family protein
MYYNWQQKDWPNFTYNKEVLKGISFDLNAGKLTGIVTSLNYSLKEEALVELLITEAAKTSEIEGEIMSRVDVMSSIKKNLGIHEKHAKQLKDQRAIGIAEMVVANRNTFGKPLSKKMLFEWHTMVMKGTPNVNSGSWRKGKAPMQIVSGTFGREKVYFEAPPSSGVPEEMKSFITWFNQTKPGKVKGILHPVIKAAIAHLYFESIHPFEDGNGRIGRLLAEKALSQFVGHPIILGLSAAIEKNKKNYYSALKKAQRSNDITNWIKYFEKTIKEAQQIAENIVNHSIAKMHFYDRFESDLNMRQQKVVNKMFEAGPDGFEGGMSAKKYQRIARISKPTATRDLQHLSRIGAFKAKAGGRSTHYELNI